MLLSFNGPLATKYVSLNNERCLARPNPIDLNPDKLYYYRLMFCLGSCNESCNTLDDLSVKTCLPNKTENVNLNVFNMITGIS